MKLIVVLLVTIIDPTLIAVVQPSAHSGNIKPIHEVSDASSGLVVNSARIKGRKLIVIGDNFDEGAVVLVNGDEMKTIRDSESATTRLVAKKAGNAIPLDTIYTVSVRNSTGEDDFIKNFRGSLFNASVLLDWHESQYSSTQGAVYVAVGDYILTTLPQGFFDLANIVRIDSAYLERVTEFVLPSSDYRLYRTIQSGVTTFRVEWYSGGEYPPLVYYSAAIIIN